MNIKDLFTNTNQALNDVVVQISPEQFDLVMPDYAAYNKGQTLRTHLNICAHENACVPRMLAAEKNIPTNQENTEDYLKDDFKTNYGILTKTANEAVIDSSDEDLDRVVHMSYADVPARDYLKDIVIQRSMAAIDIAQAAGIQLHWPDELLQAIIDIVQPYAPTLRQYGIFPAEIVTVDDSASLQDKLIALMGRHLQ